MTKLDRCWKNCLRMWKWISENWESNDIRATRNLKEDWLKSHRFNTEAIVCNCFFCQFNTDRSQTTLEDVSCRSCPGKLVRPRMAHTWCEHTKTDWRFYPKAFYAKLLALNRQRLKEADKS